jgi:prepilin-type N-terminal cleavage/methylation domain-containing protein
MSPLASARGFTLVETLIATSILVTALAGIAQLFVLSMHLTRGASASGSALVTAQQKLEALRGLAFTYDHAGAPVTASELAPSLSASLDEDIEGNVDWVDDDAQAGDHPEGAAFVRRWRVSSLDGSADAISIEVCVFKPPASAVSHQSAEACLSAIRTRQP